MGTVSPLVFPLFEMSRVRPSSKVFYPIGRIAARVEMFVVRRQIMPVVMAFVAQQARTVAMVLAPISLQIQIAVDVGSLAIAALSRASASVVLTMKPVATILAIQSVPLIPIRITVGAAAILARLEKVVVMAIVLRLQQIPIAENAVLNANMGKIARMASAYARTVNHRWIPTAIAEHVETVAGRQIHVAMVFASI